MSTGPRGRLLRPCPFCGSDPNVIPWHGGPPTKRMVCCDNEDCAVRPQVSDDSAGKATRLWNTRVSPLLPEPEPWMLRAPSGAEMRVQVVRPHENTVRIEWGPPGGPGVELRFQGDAVVARVDSSDRSSREVRMDPDTGHAMGEATRGLPV